jgi:hypothetical protein
MIFDALVHGPLHVRVALFALKGRVTTLARTIIVAIIDSLFPDDLFWRRAAETHHATTSVQSRVPGIARNLTRIEAQFRERWDVFHAIAKKEDLVAWN